MCVFMVSDFTYPQPGSTRVRKHKGKKVTKYKHEVRSREKKNTSMKETLKPKRKEQGPISRAEVPTHLVLSLPVAKEKREMQSPHCPESELGCIGNSQGEVLPNVHGLKSAAATTQGSCGRSS